MDDLIDSKKNVIINRCNSLKNDLGTLVKSPEDDMEAFQTEARPSSSERVLVETSEDVKEGVDDNVVGTDVSVAQDVIEQMPPTQDFDPVVYSGTDMDRVQKPDVVMEEECTSKRKMECDEEGEPPKKEPKCEELPKTDD